MKMIHGRWSTITALSLLLMSINSGTAQQPEKPNEADAPIAILINCINSRCHVDDKCLVMVTIANMTGNTIYIPMIDNPSIDVRDLEGNAIGRGVIEEPPPPPQDHYMQNGNERVLMEPVWELSPYGGVVKVIPDALIGYNNHLKSGKYILQLPLTSLATYRKDDIVLRENMSTKLWVRVDVSDTKIPVIQKSALLEIE